MHIRLYTFGLISSGAVDMIFCLYYALALGHAVKIVVGRVVLGRAIHAVTIAAQLTHRFHAGGTAVNNLNEVEVTAGFDGDTHDYAVAYGQCGLVDILVCLVSGLHHHLSLHAYAAAGTD